MRWESYSVEGSHVMRSKVHSKNMQLLLWQSLVELKKTVAEVRNFHLTFSMSLDLRILNLV